MGRTYSLGFAIIVEMLSVGCSDPKCAPDELKVADTCFARAKRDGGAEEASDDDGDADEEAAGRSSARPDANMGRVGASGDGGDIDASPAVESSTAQPSQGNDGSNDDTPDGGAAQGPPLFDSGHDCMPLDEVCDGRDQDCDGIVDNGLINACGAPCGQVVPPEDCGTPSDDNCDGRTNEGCTPPPPTCVAAAEICDGKDQDCDGVPDNGVKNTCGTCGAVPPETCDGKDNDCDGMIDEELKNACGSCEAAPAEVCDGVDNDCDGAVDEGLKNACGSPCVTRLTATPGEPCTNGLKGQCLRSGQFRCASDGTLVCSAETIIGTTEICDGQDNDCDGLTDNGVLNACGGCGTLVNPPRAPCDVGVGACRSTGSYVCVGKEVACNAIAKPAVAEVCGNRVDDNCDGQFSEGCTCYECEGLGGGRFVTYDPGWDDPTCVVVPQQRCADGGRG